MPILYVNNPDVVLREKDANGAMLFNPDTNQIKMLNATGLTIWELCSQGTSEKAIIDALCEEFDDVPQDSVGIHVKSFLSELQQDQFMGTSETHD